MDSQYKVYLESQELLQDYTSIYNRAVVYLLT